MVYLQIFCASTRNTSRLELEVILFGLRPFRASVKSKLCRYLGTRVSVLLHGSPPTEYISLNRLTSLRSLYSILQLKRQTARYISLSIAKSSGPLYMQGEVTIKSQTREIFSPLANF